MMQYVATAKSQVAAFATTKDSNSLTDSQPNEQFSQLLHDQKSLHSLDDASKKSAQLQKTNEKSSNQPTDEIKKEPYSVIKENTKTQTDNTSHSSQDNTAIQCAAEGNDSEAAEIEADTNKQELQSVLTSKQDHIESSAESDNVVVQEWVSLVDNLQKLADIARLKEIPLTDIEAESLDASAMNSKTETALKNLTSVAKQGESLGHATSNSDINNILNLTDNKLVKVLENIAQQLFDGKKTSEPMSSENVAKQALVTKATDIISAVESSTKDFVAALKSGIEEFKNQLSQGTEQGFDLKALVSDALAKSTNTEDAAKTSMNVDLMLKNISEVINVTQTMNRATEHNNEQTYGSALRDVAQIQGEQSKQVQLNQSESKFDKAINIAKPEGHQLLAEKVRWMMNTKNLVAEIRLDPAELGSVHVKISVTGESATINFVVQSQQTRDAMDNATPRLREMLAEKGIELGQSSVRQENDGQQADSEDGAAKSGGNSKSDTEDTEVSEHLIAQHDIVNGSIGGIDYFV